MIFKSLLSLSYFTLLHQFANNTWCSAIPDPKSSNATVPLPRTIDPSTPVRYYDAVELDLIWQACQDIYNLVSGEVFFIIGNSGGYLSYCFDHPRMKPIPMSKARRYGGLPPAQVEPDPQGYGILPKPDWKFQLKYYNDYIKNKVGDRKIDRIILVDHSSSGRSVDATRTRLLDSLWQDAYEKKMTRGEFGRERQWSGKFLLYNFIDSRHQRQTGGGFEIMNPVHVPIFRQFTAGLPHQVDRLLADEGHHDRVQAEYYPSRWHLTTKQVWGKDGGLPQAKRMRQQIKEYVESRNNGQLLKPPGLKEN